MLALAVAVGGSLLSLATPASAYCQFDLSEVTGRSCDNTCTLAGWAIYQATGQPVPLECPA